MCEESGEVVAETSANSDASDTPPSGTADLSTLTVGQQLSGKVVGAKTFGVFIESDNGLRVLLPKSQLTRGTMNKLTEMSKAKSQDLINYEIASIDVADNKVSGKYLPEGGLKDIESITKDDLKSTEFTATVVGTHDFGMFVELDSYLVDGLIPASMLPRGRAPDSFKQGESVTVTIQNFGEGGKKMTCKLAGAAAEAAATSGSDGDFSNSGFTKDRWIQGQVTGVTAFGLFVRPAGHEVNGLVHISQIPRDLTNALKKRVTIDASANKTDVEQLFQEGDVVSCRVNSFGGPKKIDMSMLPPREAADDDDYVVEGRDPEEGAGQGGRPKRASKFAETNEDSLTVSSFDGQSKLLWWKGEPYVPTPRDSAPVAMEPEMAIIAESDKIVEGTWRRMFELDMREDQNEFSSKASEQEEKELAEDIGELMGMDEDIFGDNDFNVMISSGFKVGLATSGLSDLPDDWKAQLEFFKETENVGMKRDSLYKGGKSTEQQEFDAIVREIESDIASNPKAAAALAVAEEAAAPPPTPSPETVVAEAVAETEAPEAEAEAPAEV